SRNGRSDLRARRAWRRTWWIWTRSRRKNPKEKRSNKPLLPNSLRVREFNPQQRRKHQRPPKRLVRRGRVEYCISATAIYGWETQRHKGTEAQRKTGTKKVDCGVSFVSLCFPPI